MSPSAVRRSSTRWVAANTPGSSTRTAMSDVMSKNRRQLSPVAASRQSVSR